MFYVHVRPCIEQAPHVFGQQNRNASKCSVKYAGVIRRTVGKNDPPSLMPRFPLWLSYLGDWVIDVGGERYCTLQENLHVRVPSFGQLLRNTKNPFERRVHKIGAVGRKGGVFFFFFTISAPDIGESFTASETRGSRTVAEREIDDPTTNGSVPCLPREGYGQEEICSFPNDHNPVPVRPGRYLFPRT